MHHRRADGANLNEETGFAENAAPAGNDDEKWGNLGIAGVVVTAKPEGSRSEA